LRPHPLVSALLSTTTFQKRKYSEIELYLYEDPTGQSLYRVVLLRIDCNHLGESQNRWNGFTFDRRAPNTVAAAPFGFKILDSLEKPVVQ
jgi:hypothetical protein